MHKCIEVRRMMWNWGKRGKDEGEMHDCGWILSIARLTVCFGVLDYITLPPAGLRSERENTENYSQSHTHIRLLWQSVTCHVALADSLKRQAAWHTLIHTCTQTHTPLQWNQPTERLQSSASVSFILIFKNAGAAQWFQNVDHFLGAIINLLLYEGGGVSDWNQAQKWTLL